MNVSSWCTKVIRWSFYLLFILVPLILTPVNYELFEFNKMMVTYAITIIIASAWLIKMVSDRQVRIVKTPLDVPIALFVASQLVSSVFSIDPHVSWLGYYSRFNGGMWSVISYVVLYYACVTNFSTSGSNEAQREDRGSKSSIIYLLLRVILGTASVVALYGVAEHFGIDKHLWVQDVQDRVFSTLGQPNWLAAYLIALFPIAMALALQTQITKLKTQNNIKVPNSKQFGSLNFEFPLDLGFWIWSFISVLFFLVLLFTRSRSGLLGITVADVLFWVVMYLSTKDVKRILPAGILLHVLFVVIVFFNGTSISQIDNHFTLSGIQNIFASHTASKAPTPAPPASTGPQLEEGGTESGTIRKYVWQAAVFAWQSSVKTVLIGTGTETFTFDFYRFRPAGHNLTSEWDFLYNKAHNEYLNYLATTGLFGLGSYLFFIGAFIVWFIKSQILSTKSKINLKTQIQNSKQFGNSEFGFPLDLEFGILELALFAGWISILITNFFGFSVVIMQLLLFLIPAMAFVISESESKMLRVYVVKLAVPSWISWLVAISGILLVVRVGSYWYADKLYATAYRLARSGQYAQAENYDLQSIAINSNEPVYHDELATTIATIAVSLFDQQNATLGGQLANRALKENDLTLMTSPQNVNFWKTRTKIFYSLSAYDPKLNTDAINALTQASALSPNDPKIYYNLAILYGRQGDNQKAISLLQKSISLKRDYHDAYYALYIFYIDLKQPDLAKGVLQDYVSHIDAKDQQFTELLGKMGQ
ncbi:MAG TPA: O-antigen ligase family protein [Patescibacteria group bacterium]|nr:O-antigen ligase family protein [Patescibacteria group bacterium]